MITRRGLFGLIGGAMTAGIVAKAVEAEPVIEDDMITIVDESIPPRAVMVLVWDGEGSCSWTSPDTISLTQSWEARPFIK